MRLRTQCRECGLPFKARLEPGSTAVVCPNCAAQRAVEAGGWRADEPERIRFCPLCGSRHLYRERDFNRALGCLLVVIGAALVPWTYGLSLILLSLVDLWLYRRLSLAVVCYRCDTLYRDARPTAGQGEFDLLKHDVLKYGKTWHKADGPRPPLWPEEGAAQAEGDAARTAPTSASSLEARDTSSQLKSGSSRPK